ncbi:uncharacterized protein LOC143515022 isoform X1 [Brachyhypopomus gauderio]|uniref:uncharacterized protein LOC143515022 isoform X1 n=1 Tax=Brachyhypopomus gauderio TaxID=698409 RepID=UPI004041470C
MSTGNGRHHVTHPTLFPMEKTDLNQDQKRDHVGGQMKSLNQSKEAQEQITSATTTTTSTHSNIKTTAYSQGETSKPSKHFPKSTQSKAALDGASNPPLHSQNVDFRTMSSYQTPQPQ